jgi:hypothetical protein
LKRERRFWPLAGGSALLGAGQLQWSPLVQKQIALVEFNLSWHPHPPGELTNAPFLHLQWIYVCEAMFLSRQPGSGQTQRKLTK